MTRRTGFLFEEMFLWHDTGTAAGIVQGGLTVQPGKHAESPESKRRFRDLLAVSGLLDHLEILRAEKAEASYLERFHDADYLDRLREASEGIGGDAGEITPFGHGGFEIAALAAGGTLAALEAVVEGRVANAYALVRPPGHHAEPGQGRAFCMFANIALAVLHAKEVHGLRRIAIVDWDVHHANGTELAFYGDPGVLTISMHQDRFFPQDTGGREDRGEGAGYGFNINIPLPPGSGVGAYLECFDRIVAPALRLFGPELIVVGSGFDASALDPLGRMLLHSEGYRSLTARLMQEAKTLCDGRIVMSHEGGYSEYYTPYCGLAVIEELSGIASGIADPFLPMLERIGGQELQSWQHDAIEQCLPALDYLAKR